MTAKDKLFAKIDANAGLARRTYYVYPLSEYMTGRGKSATASLASNPGVQFGQSQWKASATGAMTGGGGTQGKSKFWQMLCGLIPPAVDKDTGEAWSEAQRWLVAMDMLLFRAFPSAISFTAHLALSALSDTMLKTEAKKRWGAKVATAFVAWHKATIVFLSAISELSESSPAKHKPASNMPSLSALTGHGKKRAKAKKTSSRPVAPSSAASARAKEIAQTMPAGKAQDAAEEIATTIAKVDAMAPVK